MRDRNIIYLIGFMGVGKTTVGKVLGSKTGYEVQDLDQYIVEHEYRTISEIFAMSGEEGFRIMETNALHDVSKRKGKCVVSCGGGIVIKQENVDSMHRTGTVVYLRASVETLVERLKGCQNRPLMGQDASDSEIRKRVQNLLQIRCHRYEDAADIIIDTDDKALERICDEIISHEKILL